MRVEDDRPTNVARIPNRSAISRYVIALLIIASALFIRWPLSPWLGDGRPYLTLFGAVALAVWFARWRAAAITAFIGFVASNYFLVAPGSGFFNQNVAVEFLVYGLSTGFIIFFGECMHRAKEREVAQKNLLSVTLASIGDGVIVTDPRGAITFMNGEAERLTGWKSPDAAGRQLTDVFHIINEETRETIEGPVEKILRMGMVVGLGNHTVLIAKDGREIPIDDSGAPIRSTNGQLFGVVLIFRDFTERKQAEGALREREEHFHTMADSAPVLIWMSGLDKQCTWFNQRWLEFTGRTMEQEVGNGWSEDVHPEDLASCVESYTKGFKARRPFTMQYRLRRHDGAWRWILNSGSPILGPAGEFAGYIGSCIDITEQKEAAQVVRQSEERLHGIISSAMDAVITIDSDQRIVLFNPAAEKMFGFNAVDLIGQKIDRLIPERFRTKHGAHVGAFGHTGTSNRRMGALGAISGMRASGEEFPIEASISQVEVASEKLFTVILRDITERKWVEEALQHAKQNAEEAKRHAEEANRAKDQFLAMLSHELRTPLTPALMTATSLEADSTIPKKLRPQLAMMRRNIELEARLIDDLLDVTRIAHGKLELRSEPVDVHAALEHALGISASELNAKKMTVTKKLDARDHFCRGDATRLHEVFWNILRNAVKFTPEGGRIDIVTRNDDGHLVIIEFRDNGIGIEKELHSRIFDVFEQGEPTVHARYGGLGLGLAISKRIINLHNGMIAAQSAGRGRGSTFIVALDALDVSQLKRFSARRLPKLTKRHVRSKILVVEDHKDTAAVLRRILESAGCVVSHCTTIAQAKTATEKQKFDLAICDIGLPDGSGLDLMRHLREIHDLTGIALSGFGTQDDVDASKAAGFALHLTKPVDLERLRVAIADLLGTTQSREMRATSA